MHLLDPRGDHCETVDFPLSVLLVGGRSGPQLVLKSELLPRGYSPMPERRLAQRRKAPCITRSSGRRRLDYPIEGAIALAWTRERLHQRAQFDRIYRRISGEQSETVG